MHHFQSIFFVTETLIAKARLKSLYLMLGLKVITDFAKSPNFEKVRKQFNYGSGTSKAFLKQTIGLQCYLTIPRRVKILHENRIDFNKNKDVFKDLNEFPPLNDWFP